MRKNLYREGDWFAVPLQDDEYAVGLIARKLQNGSNVLCYFFGPRHASLPGLRDIESYESGDAVAIKIVDDTALMSGEWPVLGAHGSWDRQSWPIPDFGHHLPSQAYRVHYVTDDLSDPPTYTPITVEEYERLPRFGYSSPLGVQRVLVHALTTGEQPDQSMHRDDKQPTEVAPTVDYYLYFPSKAAATRASHKLELQGYKVEIRKSDADWLTLAIHLGSVTPKELDDAEAEMTSMAKSEGGEYDGYERDVVS